VTIDAEGNAWIAGSDIGPGIHTSFFVWKLDPAGRELWSFERAGLMGPGHSLAVDGGGVAHVSGNIGTRAIAIAVGRDGSPQWEATFDDRTHLHDASWGEWIWLDPLGNAVMAVGTFGGARGADMAAMKMDPGGGRLWEMCLDVPGSAFDIARAVTVGADGNVAVAGTWCPRGGAGDPCCDLLALALDPGGKLLWTAFQDGAGRLDEAAEIAVDPLGNVFVTGTAEVGFLSRDILTVAYDPGGGLLWADRYDGGGDDRPCGIAVHSGVTVTIAGTSTVGRDSRAVVLRYTSGGRADADRIDLGTSAIIEAMAADAAGNIYLAGSAGETPGIDALVLKYGAHGGVEWWTTWDGPEHLNDHALAVAADGDGGAVAAGRTNLEVTTIDTDCAVLRIDPAGKLLWSDTWGTERLKSDLGTSVAIDGSGGIFVASLSKWEHRLDDAGWTVLAYDTGGRRLWTHGDEALYCAWPQVLLDGLDIVVASRRTVGDWSLSHRSDSSGDWWTGLYEGFPAAIAADGAGGIVVASSVEETPSASDIVVARFAPPDSPFIRGDCDGDGVGAGTVTDPIFLLEFNFMGGPPPPCLAACDANGDGKVTGDVADAVYLLTHGFLGGPPPPAPHPGCGADPDAALACEDHPACP